MKMKVAPTVDEMHLQLQYLKGLIGTVPDDRDAVLGMFSALASTLDLLRAPMDQQNLENVVALVEQHMDDIKDLTWPFDGKEKEAKQTYRLLMRSVEAFTTRKMMVPLI
jgi:hypothetical protein